MSSQALPYPGPPAIRELPVSTQVPLSTILADLDATLANLLRREFRRHGLDRVNVAFETPARDWAATLSAPTVNLFLYDLRESPLHRPMDWEARTGGDRRVDERPPLRLDVSFGISAWTRETEDEHRLLSQVVSILYAYPELSGEELVGTLRLQPIDRFPLHARLASPRDGGHSWWGSMGGAHKASIDYRVTVSCLPGTTVERGPDTRAPTVRLHDRELPRRVLDEHTSVAGTVRTADGEPAADTWIMLPDTGLVAVSDQDGRFRFSQLRSGEHHIVARGPDGRVADATMRLPTTRVDLVLTTPGDEPQDGPDSAVARLGNAELPESLSSPS